MNRLRNLIPLCLLILIYTNLPAQEQPAFGVIDDSYNVNPSGAYNHTIPLHAAPGINGMSPQLAIVYDSRSGISNMGYGWALTGLSKITRSGNNYAQQGESAPISLTSKDAFLLDGQYMSCVEGQNGASNSKYKTENESFSVIWSMGSVPNSESSPRYFVVKQANGLTYYYGSDSGSAEDARLTVRLPSGKMEAMEWNVKKIIDVYGNYISFEYKTDIDNSIRIESISYTGNEKAGLEPLSKIVFRYHDTMTGKKKKVNTTYVAGVPFRDENMLKSIALLADGRFFKYYHFKYDESNDHLISIKESSDEEGKKALPETRIEWNESHSASYFTKRYVNTIPKDLIGIDLNNDGIKDYVSLKQTKVPVGVYDHGLSYALPIYAIEKLKDGNRRLVYNGAIFAGKSKPVDDIDPEKYLFVDLNGDFLPDLVTASEILFNYGFESSSWPSRQNFWPARTILEKHIDSAWSKHLLFARDAFKKDKGTVITGDLDGDGRSEVIVLSKTSKEIRIFGFRQESSVFEELFTYTGSEVEQGILRKIALSSSGKDDFFLFYPKSIIALRFFRKDGEVSTDRFQLPAKLNPEFATRLNFLDFNGDGLLDAYLERPGEKLKIWLNNGLNFSSGEPLQSPDIFTAPSNDPKKLRSFLGYFTSTKNLQILSQSRTGTESYIRDIIIKGPDEIVFDAINAVSVDIEIPIEDDISFIDLDGDGDTDINWESPAGEVNDPKGNFNFFFENYTQNFQHKLRSVTDGFGNQVRVYYSNLGDTTVYKGNPLQKFKSNYSLFSGEYTLVKKIEYFSGEAPPWRTPAISYRYADLVIERTGRGLSGFRAWTIRDDENGSRSQQEYEYEFPLTGKVKKQMTYDSQGNVTYSNNSYWKFRLFDMRGQNIFTGHRATSNLVKQSMYDQLLNWSDHRITDLDTKQFSEKLTTITEPDPKTFLKSITAFNKRGLSYIPILESAIVNQGSHIDNMNEINYEYDDYGYPIKTTHNIGNKELINSRTYLHINADHTEKSVYLLGLVSSDSSYVISYADTNADIRSEIRKNDYTYSQKGALISKIRGKGQADYEHVTTLEYDDVGNVIVKRMFPGMPLEVKEQYHYSNDRRFQDIYTNSLGHNTYYEYDNRFGLKIKELDHTRTNVITNKYDDFGNLTRTEFPDKTFISYNYQLNNNESDELFRTNKNIAYKITVSESGAEAQDYYYDPAGLELMHAYNMLDKQSTAQTGISRRTIKVQSYDSRGNVIKDHDPVFYMRQPAREGGMVLTLNSTLRNATTYDYDDIDRVKNATFANGAMVSAEYSQGRIVQYSTRNERTLRYMNVYGEQTAVKDDQGNQARYEYDLFGNVIKIVGANGEQIENEYDIVGRKIKSKDAALGTTVYNYDHFDRLIEETNGTRTVRLSYDALNRVKQKVTNEGILIWKYDKQIKGKIDSIIDPRGNITSYVYDRYGKILKETQSINSKSFTMAYVYDNYSRLISKTFPGGYSLAYEYLNNIPSKVSEIKSGKRAKVIWELLAVNSRGQVTAKRYGNGLLSKNTYDEMGMLISMKTSFNDSFNDPIKTGKYSLEEDNSFPYYYTGYMGNRNVNFTDRDPALEISNHEAFAATLNHQYSLLKITSQPARVLQNLSMKYDLDNRLTEKIDSLNKNLEGFTYDNLNRLSGIYRASDAGLGKVALSYDRNGNILYRSDLGSYEYNSNAAQQVAAIRNKGGLVAQYEYDRYGNVTNESQKGLKIEYTSFNRPATMTLGPVKSNTFYRYDQRELESFQYNNQELSIHRMKPFHDYEVIESQGKTTLLNYILVGNDLVGIHIQSDGSESNQYIQKDNIGSVQLITGEDGNLIAEYRYDPFGERFRIRGEAQIVRHGFSAHQQLDDFGLIDMSARLYDPKIGRFYSPDPFIQSPSDIQSLNRYSYVMNNPLNVIDPSGFWGIKIRAPRIKWNPARDISRGVNNIGRAVGKAHEDVYNEGDRFIDKHGKEIVVYAAAIAITYFSGGTASGLAAVMVKGAIFGATVSGGMTAANGGKFQDVMNAAFKGAYTGAASAAVFYGIGSAFSAAQVNTDFGSAGYFAKTAAHGVAGGLQSSIQGGEFKDGLLGATVSHALGPLTETLFTYQNQVLERVIFSSAVGGLAAYASGGDVMMGMTTAGYSRWFNCESKFIAKTLYDIWKRPVGALVMADNFQKGEYLTAGGKALQLVGGTLSCVPTPQTRVIGMAMSYTGTIITQRDTPAQLFRVMTTSSPGSDDGRQPGPKY